MQVTIEHVAVIGDELPVGIANAVTIIRDRVPDPDMIDFVVTGDFVASVRTRATNPHEATQYSTERGAGLAVAKTIPNGERSFIIVPAPILSTFDDLGRHAVAHEATHAALHQRGEATNDIRLRLASSDAESYYLASAGVIAEEYRVEATLAAERNAPRDTHQASIDDALEAARAAFLDGLMLRYPNESMERPSQTTHKTAHDLGIQLGYLAAELTSRDGLVPNQPPTAVTQSPLWERLVGPGWTPIAAAFSEIPFASREISQEGLDRIVVKLASALKRWILHIGFGWHDTSNGVYFDVLRQDF